MMPASKHGDPQLGVDIHLCVVPPGVPTPLPTPHISVVFDPFDYIPIVGGTITVCGMKRATAGTSGISVHIPPGFPFAKPPDKDDELFMGSSTVLADGDPFSYIALPVLSCQVAGMMSPMRLKKKGGPRIGVLPLTFNLAIPTNVFIGGAPTVSLMGMAFKGAFSGLGKLAKSGVFKRLRQKLFKNMKPGFLKCSILRAEPVNILNGEVSVEQCDFSLPGRLPIEWVRSYGSAGQHVGVCGTGWQTPADLRLEVAADGSVLLQGPQVGPLSFERLPQAPGDAAAELELADGARLSDHGDEWRVATKDDRVYHFPKALGHADAGGISTPVGWISDRCGNRLAFRHKGGRPVAIEDPAGRRLVLAYGPTPHGERLAAVTLMDLATQTEHGFVRYEYDAAGDLVAVVDALGAPYRFAYEQHRILRHTDRNGLSFHYAYEQATDEDWRVVHAWGDGGLYDYRFEYLDALNERRITDSLGHVSLVTLDERGLPICEIDPLDGRTVYEYDEAGRTIAVTDPDGHRTGYEYDERGNLLKLMRPDGTAIATTYSGDDKATTITDPNGAIWRQRWNGHGLLVEQVTPLEHVSRYEYDPRGQLVAHVNPRGARTEFGYDEIGLLNRLTDALGHATTFAHDALGHLVSRNDTLGLRTHYRYDAKGRLTGLTLPSRAVVLCGYDAEDNLVRYADENGSLTRLEYVGQGLVSRRIQPDGQSVEYRYDTEERLVEVRNQRGETYRLTRDALGRVVQEVDYWGQQTTYTYDAGGRLRGSVDPLGRTIAFSCDPLGRIRRKLLFDPTRKDPSFEETFTFDASGHLIEAANLHARITRAFDASGRLTAEQQAHIQGQNFQVKNAYDEVGNRVKRTTTSSAGPGSTADYTYNLLDRVIGISVNGKEQIHLQHDGLGRVTEERLAPGLKRSYEYNNSGLMTGQRLARQNTELFATTYRYDLAGNLLQRHDTLLGADSYVHDAMGRVLEHTDPQGMLHRFLRDPAGDLLSTRAIESSGSSSPSVHDQSISLRGWRREGEYQGTSYSYDQAGNLRSKIGSQQRLLFRWDGNQRLVETRRIDHRGNHTTHYGYDPFGRRLFKETGGRRIWFGWDGEALAADAADNGFREFLYRPGSFEPLAMLFGPQDRLQRLAHYLNDPNGRPVRLIDIDGKVIWAANHSVWGSTTSVHVAEIDNPIRLQGQYADPESGLHYNRHRYFDPDIGGFISQDPLRLGAGPDLYRYGPNSERWIDPLGLTCYKTTPMKRTYVGEHLPGNPIWGSAVKYLDDAERQLHKLEVKNGKLYDASGRLFDTASAATAHSGGGRAIFVMDEAGNIYASKVQKVGEFHHSSLLAGKPVAAAGELEVENGLLKTISDKSGHYQPTQQFTEQAVDSLTKQGADMSSMVKDLIGKP